MEATRRKILGNYQIVRIFLELERTQRANIKDFFSCHFITKEASSFSFQCNKRDFLLNVSKKFYLIFAILSHFTLSRFVWILSHFLLSIVLHFSSICQVWDQFNYRAVMDWFSLFFLERFRDSRFEFWLGSLFLNAIKLKWKRQSTSKLDTIPCSMKLLAIF